MYDRFWLLYGKLFKITNNTNLVKILMSIQAQKVLNATDVPYYVWVTQYKLNYPGPGSPGNGVNSAGTLISAKHVLTNAFRLE